MDPLTKFAGFEIGQKVEVKAETEECSWYFFGRIGQLPPLGGVKVSKGTTGTILSFPPPVRGNRTAFVLVEATNPEGETDRFAAWPENLRAVKD